MKSKGYARNKKSPWKGDLSRCPAQSTNKFVWGWVAKPA